jgi:PASTA domain
LFDPRVDERIQTLRVSTRLSILAAVGACVALLAFVGVAQAETVNVGLSLAAGPHGAKGFGTSRGILTMSASAPSSAARATADGTVTRWRVYDASAIQGYSVNVVRENGDGSWTVTASSQEVTPAAEEVQTFDTDLPILTGEYIELNVPALGGIAVFQGTSTQGSFSPPLAPGETRIISGQEASSQTFGYNAEIENPSLAPPAVIPPATSQPTPVATSVTSAPARCVVPKVIGKKLKAARKSIQKSGCSVGLVTKKHGVKAATGKVVRQSPNGSRIVAAHTAVNLKLGSVSTGPK